MTKYRGNIYTVAGIRTKVAVAKSEGLSRVVLPMADGKYLPSSYGGMELCGAADIFDLLELTLKGRVNCCLTVCMRSS